MTSVVSSKSAGGTETSGDVGPALERVWLPWIGALLFSLEDEGLD
jgi:hypothetical protein